VDGPRQGRLHPESGPGRHYNAVGYSWPATAKVTMLGRTCTARYASAAVPHRGLGDRPTAAHVPADAEPPGARVMFDTDAAEIVEPLESSEWRESDVLPFVRWKIRLTALRILVTPARSPTTTEAASVPN